MNELPPSAARVQAAADAIGLDITIREMPASTRTAEEAAAACSCDVAQIVKSLVFRGRDSGAPKLLLVSGKNRVNEAAFSEPLVRPDAAYVRSITGYAIGGIPPFGHDTPIETWIDRDLLAFETVWAAAGTPKCLFAVDPARLVEKTGARAISVT